MKKISAVWMPLFAVSVLTACGDSGPTAPAKMALTVTFEGNGSITASPQGLTCVNKSCTGAFEPGTQVTIQATAENGHRFKSWGGECAGHEACVVVMDRARSVAAVFESKVDANGFSPEINALIPAALFARLDSLGMPIFSGATPPNIEGIFQALGPVLLVSTVPSDPLTGTISDYDLQFSGQNNDSLTVAMSYVSSPETGYGLGSFIVGTDSNFTVFTKVLTIAFGDTADNIQIFSGRIHANGISDLHIAGFVLDNRGNPHGYFIPNETGRIFADPDGFSERISSLPTVAQISPPGLSVAPRLFARSLLLR